jgi:iron complex transport system substrate-binding protein
VTPSARKRRRGEAGRGRAKLALALAAALLAHPAAAQPARIVSLNVCADQLLLLLLADKGRIAALTQHATNADFTNMPEAAQGFRQNAGRAEEVLPLRPDLVIGGEYTTAGTLQLLRRVGVRVETLPLANSLEDVRANMRRLAGWIGEEARGAALIAAFDARLAAIRQRLPQGRRPVLALYQTRGYTAAPGTLAASIVEAAGFDNLAAQLRLGFAGRLTLEDLLARPLDALAIVDVRGQAPSLEAETVAHPALRRAGAGKRIVALPSRLWVCETPHVLDAVAAIAALHRAAPGGERPP